MRLEPPPLWQHLLLEQPWPVIVALGVAVVVLTVLAQRHRRRGLRIAAWGLAVLAGGIYAVAWQVTTDREQLLEATEALVAATESPMDPEAFAARWLGDNAVLTGADGEPWLDRDAIERTLRSAHRRYTIEQHATRRLDAATGRPGLGRSVVELSTQAGGGRMGAFGPVRTEWDLRWKQNEHGEWRVYEIRWVRFRDRQPNRNLLPP